MNTTSENGLPLVFVTVGTDHHPFERVVRWIDGWLEAGGSQRAKCFVQRGTSPAPRLAASADYLTYEEMRTMMEKALAVVSHGGPATIMLANHAGKTTIVVPREKRLGEHVDDHQVAFARRLAREGSLSVAETEPLFHELLGRAVSAAAIERNGERRAHVLEAVHRFENLVEKVCGTGATVP